MNEKLLKAEIESRMLSEKIDFIKFWLNELDSLNFSDIQKTRNSILLYKEKMQNQLKTLYQEKSYIRKSY